MAKSPKGNDEPDVATRIMERMVRMPPKPHEDMKVGKNGKMQPEKLPKQTKAKQGD